jgi:molecular chaperone GrpE (heat shock protein)
MSGIPEEYLRDNQDFGFSAIDELEVRRLNADEQSNVTEQVVQQVSASTNETIARLETKLNDLLYLQKKSEEEIDEAKSRAVEEVSEKLIQVEKMIMPLLMNLMKNEDKEYIYWPNRQEKLKSQIDSILAITRG